MKTKIVEKKRIWLILILVIIFLIGSEVTITDARKFWLESWESSNLGTYVPGVNEQIKGDTGMWEIGDTVSTECPEVPTPTSAQVLESSKGKYLLLTSQDSNSDCSDNIWIGNLELVDVPITNNTILSFEEYGDRGIEERFDHYYCYFCAIELGIVDNHGNVIRYTLQEHPSFKPVSGFQFTTIRLGGSGGIYKRNLYEDFMTVDGFSPEDAKVNEVIFEIDGPVYPVSQWATIDNISIGRDITPILLVYGWHGSTTNWDILKPRLEEDDYSVEVLKYDDSQSVAIASVALSQKINEMFDKYDADKVNIIAHSYGGLVSRYYIEKAGGKKNVRNLVMIATPNHGSRLADYLTGELKDEKAKNIAEFILEFYGMFRPDSKWGSTLDLRTINNNFLDILNIGFDYGKIKVDTKYFVIAGTGHYPKKFSSHSMFLPGHDDGVVALSSASLQSKGVPLYCFELDHSSTVNPHNVLDRSYSEQLARVSLLGDAYVDVITKILEGSPPSSSVAPCPTGNDEDDSQWLPNLLEHLIVRMKSGEGTADNFDVSSESTIEVGITFSFSDFNFTLTTPSGLKITPEVAAQNPDIDYIKNDNYWYYLINNPERGTWNYNVSAIEIPTEGENVGIFVIGDGNVSLQGDVDGNCKVDIFDLAKIGLCYGQSASGDCINADLSGNGVINIFDLATVGLNYGKSC